MKNNRYHVATGACAWAAMLLSLAVLAALPARAQNSLLPPACARLSGDALDQCVRNITTPVIVPNLEATELPPPDPAALANCTRVLAADQEFCIWRNEILLACRNRAKYPDFGSCYTTFIANVNKPLIARCEFEKTEVRATCSARNAVFAKCLEDPLGYFLCLATQGRPAEKPAKP